MASDEENNLEELLGRVSDKLGWGHIQQKDVKTAFRKPSENGNHKKKKSVRSSSKKVPRKSRKDTSSSSDKENSIKNRHHHKAVSESNSKAEINCRGRLELSTSSCNVLTQNNDCDKNDEANPSKSSLESSAASKKAGKDYKKDFDLNSSVSEAYTAADESSKQGESLKASNEKVSTADENGADFLNSESFENPSLLSSDEDDLARKTLDEDSPSVPKRDVDELEEPFSPLQRYSETAQPMTWLLTPPPKENLVKASSYSAEKISMVVISDSESDSPFDSYDLDHKNREVSSSTTKTDWETQFSPGHVCRDSETPDFSKDPFKVTQSAEKITTVTTFSSSESDAEDDSACSRQVLSLTERLSKNFKLQKSKPVSNVEDGHSGKDISWTKGDKSRDDNQRILQTPRAPLYASSDDDDDDDFEQFLQAIKTPHCAPPSSQTPKPTVDEDQYEKSFIDDTPIVDEDNDDDDVYYYRHINSDQKIFTDKKKEQETKTQSTPWKYRLPQFSDSDDADDSVFATPKPPAAKKITPSVLSSSKKFRPPISQKRDTPTTERPTDFMSSLATPKHGCSSSSPYVNDFKKHREALTQKLFGIYNKTVFDNKLPSDFSIKWNNRMRKTAGYCYYTKTKLTGQYSARIELSEKVCDTAERLRDTLVHELCHAACWLINRVNDGHGRFWKYWAAKANHAHPCIPIIKRCHSYEITTKYKYQCVTCKTTIGRHSKSINTSKFCCAYCKGNLVLLPSINKDGKVSKVRTPNKFAMFVKENYGSVKKENVSMKHADIMRLLSQDFSKKATISV
ncbi:acidic repeat-containing protein-like isoform X2 [Patiria miniata]|uniref:SprT-like domain-containing protein n=1 Tax=Patiria miniata TaxID=46514 RepID=A0A913ZYQ5_PATMI|nr:acidic repeat-containing protein-like isoform X2 [Patiria miniata]